ncbi:MAG: hypothetical protein ACRDNW_02510, partial [Trebonia sp.]
ALGGMGVLDRDRREGTLALFHNGPVVPGRDPEFPPRLVSQFVPQEQPTFQTTEGDEYRSCETTISVADARDVWDRLESRCVPAPEPPVRDLPGLDAFVSGCPAQFWVRNSGTELEYVGKDDVGRLTNLGTVKRTRQGFTVNAKSVRRAADLTTIVLDTTKSAGLIGRVTGEESKTAAEMLADGAKGGDGPGGREAMCRRLGLDATLAAVPPRELIVEEYFHPMDPDTADAAVIRAINREFGVRAMVAAATYDGRTAAEAVAAGGALRDRVLAMIDDCEWRLGRADPEEASLLPRPGELTRRVGLR